MERRSGGVEAAMKMLLAKRICGGCGVLLCALVLPCGAQDRRTVAEPKIPSICTVVKAKLSLHEGRLDAEDESRLDTVRLQRALDGCQAGDAVELAPSGASHAFLIGPVTIPPSVTLLVDDGVTVMASRDPRLYDLTPGSCGVVNEQPAGCKAVVSIKGAAHAAVMGDGVIDGRGGETLLHESGNGPLNGPVSWWDLAEKARAGGRQQVPRLIVADHSDDFRLYRITLRNSANFHVVFSHGRGLTVWGLKIDTPKTARNTDGVDPGSAEDITVTHSFIRTGDDNIAIKGSEGGVGYMSVIDNHFYYGHGMSIGSETYGGVHDVQVNHLSLDGPDNGIRIKSNPSRGGLVDRVRYSDVCIRDSKWPIVLDTRYNNPGPYKNSDPVYRNIRLADVRIFGGGRIGMEGIDPRHVVEVGLDGVMLDDPKSYELTASYAAVQYGPGPVNFRMAGKDVTSSGKAGSGTLDSCSAMFVPFPVHR